MRHTLQDKTIALAFGLLSFASLVSTRAQLISYDGFNYTPGTDLVSQSIAGPGDSFGWAAPWGGANTPITTNVAGSLGYIDSVGNVLQTDGGRVIIGSPAGTTTSAQLTRSFTLGTLNGTRYSGPTNTPSVYW